MTHPSRTQIPPRASVLNRVNYMVDYLTKNGIPTPSYITISRTTDGASVGLQWDATASLTDAEIINRVAYLWHTAVSSRPDGVSNGRHVRETLFSFGYVDYHAYAVGILGPA